MEEQGLSITESVCATTMDGAGGRLRLGGRGLTQSCVDPEKAFQQKTWPWCRNGHHFTVQRLRPSVEAGARMARLKTVSGGLLRSVEPNR